MAASAELAGEGQGFSGHVEGMSLHEMIQLGGNRRFSGCIAVRNGNGAGRVFFRDGKVIHAEHAEASGELAFYELMAWRSGSFSLEPNVSTTRCTIDKDLGHLLLSAFQWIDERRAGIAGPPPAAPPADAVERIRNAPGVAHAVMAGRNGACRGDANGRAGALAGKVAYLAIVGEAVGKAFGLAALSSAVLDDGSERALLLVADSELLGVIVDREADVNAIEDELRGLVSGAT